MMSQHYAPNEALAQPQQEKFNTLNQSISWDRLPMPLSQASSSVPSSTANATAAHPTPVGEGKRGDRSLPPLLHIGEGKRGDCSLSPSQPLAVTHWCRCIIPVALALTVVAVVIERPSGRPTIALPSLTAVAVVAEHPSGPPTIALPSFVVYGDDVGA